MKNCVLNFDEKRLEKNEIYIQYTYNDYVSCNMKRLFSFQVNSIQNMKLISAHCILLLKYYLKWKKRFGQRYFVCFVLLVFFLCLLELRREGVKKKKTSSIQQTHRNTNLSRMKRISEWGLF